MICTALCSKSTQNILPGLPLLRAGRSFLPCSSRLNLRGIKTSARINDVMAAGMTIVVVIFFVFVIRFVWGLHEYGPGFFTQPFYNPATFSLGGVFRGTSIAVLTYIGFDGISTLSEEVEDPRRNIMLATVLVCVITGVLASLECMRRNWLGIEAVSSGKSSPAFPMVARQLADSSCFNC